MGGGRAERPCVTRPGRTALVGGPPWRHRSRMTIWILWAVVVGLWLTMLIAAAILRSRGVGDARKGTGRARGALLRLVSLTPAANCVLLDGVLERGEPVTLAIDPKFFVGDDLASLRSWSEEGALVELRVDPGTWTAQLRNGVDDLHVALAGLS